MTPRAVRSLFLWIGRGVSALTGENIVAAVLCHRLVVLIGVGLIVWATPPARRCGVAEVSALWLGAPTAADHASGRGHPQRSADVGSDAARPNSRCGPRCLDSPKLPTPRPTTGCRAGRDRHAALRRGADHAVLAGEIAVAAALGFVATPGPPLGGSLRPCCWPGR
ncbi:mannosyltransferase MptB domain protein [Mycobacterium xenopi 3993]|nr:mannosyltransferase MptB domain protein [Mycobacterium xenopi 3993]